MNHNTTALELLSSGATIESGNGSASEALSVTSRHTSWMHDLSLSGLMKKGAIVTMITGLGILGVDDQVVLFEETAAGEYEILSNYPQSEEGLTMALEDIDFYGSDALVA